MVVQNYFNYLFYNGVQTKWINNSDFFTKKLFGNVLNFHYSCTYQYNKYEKYLIRSFGLLRRSTVQAQAFK